MNSDGLAVLVEAVELEFHAGGDRRFEIGAGFRQDLVFFDVSKFGLYGIHKLVQNDQLVPVRGGVSFGGNEDKTGLGLRVGAMIDLARKVL